MKKLIALSITFAMIGFVIAGCAHVPPGQVKKATGYNPASGKYK